MRSVLLLSLLASPLISFGSSGCTYTLEEVTGAEPRQVTAEYVVGFRDGVTERELADLASELGLELVEARGSDRLAVFVDPLLRGQQEVTESLHQAELTDWSEPQYVYELLRTPDDYGPYLWGLNNTGTSGGTAGADIGALEAWDRSTGEGIIIAVIDTGVTASHPDLAPNLWNNPGEVAGNGIDDDNNGYVDDVHGYDFVFRDGDPDDRDGHGTHVAGIAAARGDDGYGIVGPAFDARIMAVKLLDPAGGGYASMAAEAINYAVNNGAHVINASWGGYGASQAVRNAIAYARSRGVLFVAAAGNEGYDNDVYPLYPASYPLDNILSVAATNRVDQFSDFSNSGSSTVDLAAPGTEILSTWRGDNWVYLDGTSMASPFVAGAVALLQSAAPSASAADVRESLLNTVSVLPDDSGYIISGGRLDADAAVALDQLLDRHAFASGEALGGLGGGAVRTERDLQRGPGVPDGLLGERVGEAAGDHDEPARGPEGLHCAGVLEEPGVRQDLGGRPPEGPDRRLQVQGGDLLAADLEQQVSHGPPPARGDRDG